jgi:hypothetical protein
MFDKQKTVGKLSFTIYTNRNQTKTLVRQTADRQTENQIERQTERKTNIQLFYYPKTYTLISN